MENPTVSAQNSIPAPMRPLSRDEWQAGMVAQNGLQDSPGGNLLPPVTIHEAFDFVGEDAIPEKLIQATVLLNRLESEDNDPATQEMRQRARRMINHFDALPKDWYDEWVKTLEYGEDYPLEELLIGDSALKAFALSQNLEAEGAAFPKIFEQFKKAFRRGFQKGIEQGFIPQQAVARLQDAFDKTATGVIDRDLLSSISPDSTAGYFLPTDTVVIGHKLGSGEDGMPMEHYIGHEFIHKTTGGSFGYTEDGRFLRHRAGFFNILNVDSEMPTKSKEEVDEAFVEHINTSVFYGNFGVMDPDLRAEDNPIYKINRKLTAVWIDRSGGIIEVKAGTRAEFEDSGSEGKTTDRRIFVEQYVESYGSGGFNDLNRLCSMAKNLSYEDVKEFIVPRIHGPEFDANSKMIKKGYIDMPELADIIKMRMSVG
jgi:hypothetical protein